MAARYAGIFENIESPLANVSLQLEEETLAIRLCYVLPMLTSGDVYNAGHSKGSAWRQLSLQWQARAVNRYVGLLMQILIKLSTAT